MMTTKDELLTDELRAELLAALDERDRLKIERDVYRAAINAVRNTVDDYKQDRMWAFALRKIERLVNRTGFEIAAMLDRDG